MSTNFLSLPRELRDEIYKNLLFSKEPIVIPPNSRQLYPAILLTNKMIHDEAAEVLYSWNCFNVSYTEPWNSFLCQISYGCSKLIHHLRIDFSRFASLMSSNVALENNSVWLLERIKDYPNLRTRTINRESLNERAHQLDYFDDERVMGQAIYLVDRHLQAISSAREMPSPDRHPNAPAFCMTFEVNLGAFSRHVKELMESYKWTLDILKDKDYEF